jgi:DNA topoisomerase IB
MKRYKVTAANLNLLKAYVTALYGVVISAAKDNKVSKDFRQLMLSVVKDAAKFEREIGIDVPLFQGSSEFDAANMVAEGKAIRRALRQVLMPDNTIGHDLLDQIKAASTWMINNKDVAYNKLAKLAPTLGQPILLEGLKSDSVDQKKFVRPLIKIVKFYTGRPDDPNLTQDERIKLKAENIEMFREFMRLRKEFLATWRNQLRNLVIESGKPMIDYRSAVQSLNSLGLEHTLPDGFDGLIDQNGSLYTKAGKAINGMPGPGFSIVMNPNYDAQKDDQFVFTTVTPEGKRSQHVYTQDYTKRAGKAKFQKVSNLAEQVENARKNWMTWIKKPDSSAPQVVASVILEILYQFSARIGSPGNAAGGEATYGIATLRAKHVFPQTGGGVNLIYKGKDGVRQVHRVQPKSAESKLLIRHILEAAEGKKPSDPLWTYNWNGRIKPMVPARVNMWFRKCGASVTVHKLRHVKGTQVFKELLAENQGKIFDRKVPLSQGEADRMLKALATKVGAILGHVRGVGEGQKVTGATALQAYIDPSVIVDYYNRLNLRPPKAFAKLAAEG